MNRTQGWEDLMQKRKECSLPGRYPLGQVLLATVPYVMTRDCESQSQDEPHMCEKMLNSFFIRDVHIFTILYTLISL